MARPLLSSAALLLMVVSIWLPAQAGAGSRNQDNEWHEGVLTRPSLWGSAHATVGIAVIGVQPSIVESGQTFGSGFELGGMLHFGHRFAATLDLGYRGGESAGGELADNVTRFETSSTLVAAGLRVVVLGAERFELAVRPRIGFALISQHLERRAVAFGAEGTVLAAGVLGEILFFPNLESDSLELGLTAGGDYHSGGDTAPEGAPELLEWQSLLLIGARVGWHF